MTPAENYNPGYPASNVLTDRCDLAGANQWKKDGSDAEFVIVLGCMQDVKSFLLKNGNQKYQTENFTISVATHSQG